MTSDEFQRILIALNQMAGYDLSGHRYVPLHSVTAVIYSNLHQEDRAHWRFDKATGTWSEVSDL